MAGLKKYDAIATAACVTLGLGGFAGIVLTGGTTSLSWTRLLLAALVCIGVSVASAYAVARSGLTQPRTTSRDKK